MRALRRVGLGVVVGSALLGGATLSGGPVAAQACDPSYPDVCLASYPDLDCIDIGYPITVIHDPNIGANDPHGLDADYDGVGCESS
jgi:hypothetical protein